MCHLTKLKRECKILLATAFNTIHLILYFKVEYEIWCQFLCLMPLQFHRSYSILPTVPTPNCCALIAHIVFSIPPKPHPHKRIPAVDANQRSQPHPGLRVGFPSQEDVEKTETHLFIPLDVQVD